MLLFAELYWGKFQIAKSMVPQTIIDMFKKSSSSTSPKMYEAGWSPAKCRSNILKAATPEDSRVESNGRSNEASLLPVLKQHNDMLSSDSHTIPSAVEMGSMTSEARCDLTVCAPEEYLHLYQHFNNNPAICPTHTDVQRQIRETEPENQLSTPDSADHHHVIVEEDNTAATWLVASAAPHHATGNLDLLSNFTPEHDLFVQAGDEEPMQVCGRGSVITSSVVLPDVFFVPGLANNFVSASQLTELDYCIGFARASCFIRRMTDSTIVGKASLGEDGLFQLDYLKVPLGT
jgi:hypothetical protein